jgi:hypothetical protein
MKGPQWMPIPVVGFACGIACILIALNHRHPTDQPPPP